MHTLTGFGILPLFILDPKEAGATVQGVARASRRGLIASVRNGEGRQLGGLSDTGRGKRLAAGHAVVQRVLTARRQVARHLVHDRNDLPHDVTPVAAGRAFEEIADRRPDFCLGVVFAVEMELI